MSTGQPKCHYFKLFLKESYSWEQGLRIWYINIFLVGGWRTQRYSLLLTLLRGPSTVLGRLLTKQAPSFLDFFSPYISKFFWQCFSGSIYKNSDSNFTIFPSNLNFLLVKFKCTLQSFYFRKVKICPNKLILWPLSLTLKGKNPHKFQLKTSYEEKHKRLQYLSRAGYYKHCLSRVGTSNFLFNPLARFSQLSTDSTIKDSLLTLSLLMNILSSVTHCCHLLQCKHKNR